MNKTIKFLAAASLLAFGVAQAEIPPVKKPSETAPLKAKPVKKPKATSDRDKAGASGYGSDPGEDTQERPNPLDFKPVQKPQATSDRDKAGASGYGSDPGEDTQERPNPLDFKPAQTLDPLRDPAGGPPR